MHKKKHLYNSRVMRFIRLRNEILSTNRLPPPDSIVFCRFLSTIEEKFHWNAFEQIEFDKVKKRRSFSTPIVDVEICHQTVEMIFKGNVARMSTMKKLLEEDRWSSLHFHRWFIVEKRQKILLDKSLHTHQWAAEIIEHHWKCFSLYFCRFSLKIDKMRTVVDRSLLWRRRERTRFQWEE